MNQNTPTSDAPMVSTMPGAPSACFDAAPAHGTVASALAPADTNTTVVSACITDPAPIDTRYQRAAELLVRCALPHLHPTETDEAPEPNPPAHMRGISTDVNDANSGLPDDSPISPD